MEMLNDTALMKNPKLRHFTGTLLLEFTVREHLLIRLVQLISGVYTCYYDKHVNWYLTSSLQDLNILPRTVCSGSFSS